jgi:hypothetical protein
MPNKPVIAICSLATFLCAASSAQAQSCHPKALFSLSSDLVGEPYTFGGELDYRPVWVELPVGTGHHQKMTKRRHVRSSAHRC